MKMSVLLDDRSVDSTVMGRSSAMLSHAGMHGACNFSSVHSRIFHFLIGRFLNLGVRRFINLVVRKFRNLIVWRFRNLVVWGFRNLEVEKFCNLKMLEL